MKKSVCHQFSLFSVILLLTVISSGAQDWPQWRGPERDGKTSGFIPPQIWPKELTPNWKVVVGDGDSTPALVGEHLYVFTRQGDEEVIQCLNAADGSKVWENRYTAQATTGGAARHPGPRSSPTVVDGKVITLGVGGVLSCLDASNGNLIWRKDEFPGVVPQFFTSMSPLVVDGMVIAHLGGAGNGAIIAFDLTSGTEKWRWSGEGPEYASPVLLTVEGVKQIVTLSEKSIVGIASSDGKLLWQLPFVPERRAYNAATPIVLGQKVFFTGAKRGTRAIQVVKQGDTFIPQDLWTNPDIATQYNTPILKDGSLFGYSDNGNIFCLDAETGKVNWTDATERGSGGFGAMVDVGSFIFLLPNNSEITVFKPDNKQYSEVTRIKISEKPTYATPVISGHRLFIKDQDSLALMTWD